MAGRADVPQHDPRATGSRSSFGGVEFTVRDTGAGESGADTYWTASALPGVVFAGDLIYPFLDAYNADGFSGQWLAKIDRLETRARRRHAPLPRPRRGGDPGGPRLAAALPGAAARGRRATGDGQPTLTDAQKAEVKQRMDAFVPDQRLEFFVDISLDAVAAELAASG